MSITMLCGRVVQRWPAAASGRVDLLDLIILHILKIYRLVYLLVLHLGPSHPTIRLLIADQ